MVPAKAGKERAPGLPAISGVSRLLLLLSNPSPSYVTSSLGAVLSLNFAFFIRMMTGIRDLRDSNMTSS